MTFGAMSAITSESASQGAGTVAAVTTLTALTTAIAATATGTSTRCTCGQRRTAACHPVATTSTNAASGIIHVHRSR